MAVNWGNIGSALSGVASTLATLNISGASAQQILSSIGLSANPNMNEELSICSQILQATGNVGLQNALAMKLATEQGIPIAAAALASALGAPGTDIAARILQIEQIIKQGG